ncbi:MAG: hypothetical protein EOM55_02120 [Clostridia bacterium]|nr:hypothetical protein [Clostridia bacterium]
MKRKISNKKILKKKQVNNDLSGLYFYSTTLFAKFIKMETTMERKIDYGFKVFLKILGLKEFNNKKEVLDTAREMLKIAQSKNSSNEVIDSFKKAIIRLDGLEFSEIKQAVEISKIFDDREKKLKKNAN